MPDWQNLRVQVGLKQSQKLQLRRAPAVRELDQFVLSQIAASGLDQGNRKVVVMLSGGRDSVCLIDALSRSLDRSRLHALHVNYRLREESNADQQLCVELCENLGVPLTVKVIDPNSRQGNLHAWARELRYEYAGELADSLQDALITTAHTATDQVETFLYRLATSPGHRGLLAMRPLTAERLVRPLLSVDRQQTADYCRLRGLAWAEDSSNDQLDYARAKIRQRVVPGLLQVSPMAERNILRTIAQLQEQEPLLQQLADEVLQGALSISAESLCALPKGLQRLVLVRLAEQTLDSAPSSLASRVPELVELVKTPGSVGIDIGEGVRAVSEYGELRFTDEVSEGSVEPTQLALPGRVRFGSRVVVAQEVEPVPVADHFDADLLGDEGVIVRARRSGDRISPIGLDGSKTLQDLFVDRCIPQAQRDDYPLLEYQGRIICVPGLAVDQHFRIKATTERAVKISLQQL